MLVIGPMPPFLPSATKLGQGNKFTGVCLSTWVGGCLTQIFGGVSAPNFRGGVCSKFSGGVWPKFSGGSLLQICGGGSAPNFQGGVSDPNFRRGGVWPKFSGGVWNFFSFFFQFIFPPKKILLGCTHPPLRPRDGQCAAGTHPARMHPCYYWSLFYFMRYPNLSNLVISKFMVWTNLNFIQWYAQ